MAGTLGGVGGGTVAARSAGGARANVVSHGVFGTNEGGGTPLASLTQDQIQALINLVNLEPKSDDRMAGIEWILDTGASHHITGTLSVLVNVRRIAACPVGLPNGCSAHATMEGDVYLSDTLVLHHVLFVPDFQCHLISVSLICLLIMIVLCNSHPLCVLYRTGPRGL